MEKIKVPTSIKNNIINDYINGSSVLSLSNKYGYKYDKTYSIIKNENIEIRGNDFNSKKYRNNSHIFDEIDTEEKAYWLGFIYADGCIIKAGKSYKLSLSLSVSDIDHMKKYKRFLETDNPIYIYDGNHNNKYCRMIVIDNYMCEQLIDKGVYERKTEILTFPDFLQNDLIKHFIRGYVDGDGCITYHMHNINNNRYVFALKICSTKEMLYGINKFLPTNKKKEYPTLQKRRKNDVNNYSLEYGGNLQTLNILNYLYGEATIYLERKYEKYLLLKNIYS